MGTDALEPGVIPDVIQDGEHSLMNPDQEFAEILRRLAPLSDAEKTEALLAYFSASIGSMDTASLLAFRDFCRARNEDTEAEVTMLDIIEGQLALREIWAVDMPAHG